MPETNGIYGLNPLMTQAKHSIIASYLLAMLMIATLPVILVGYLWIADARQSYQELSADWQASQIQKHQAELQQQVESVLDYIAFRHSQVSDLLRQRLRDRVDEVMRMADVYAHTSTEPSTRLNAFIQTLRQFQITEGQGTFTVVTPDGTLLMGQRKPSLEQTNLLPLYRAEEQRVIKEAIQEVMEKGAVYSTIRDISQQGQGADMRLAYARYHPELNVIVINHNSLSVVTAQVQAEVIQRFGKDNDIAAASVFIVQKNQLLVSPNTMKGFDAVRLAGSNDPVEVSSLWSSGREQEEKGQAFTRYEWFNLASQQALPAMNYVKAYPQWQWLVGADMSLVDFYKEQAEYQQTFEENIQHCIVFILFVILGCLFIVGVVAYRFYCVNKEGFASFIKGISQTGDDVEPIDVAELRYSEFKQLAHHTNRIMKERGAYEQAMKKSRQRFSLALQASNSYTWDMEYSNRQLTFGGHFFYTLGYCQKAENAGYALNDFLNLCHCDDRAAVEAALSQDASQLAEAGLEFRIKNTEGDYRWFYARGGVVDDSGVGRPNRLAGIISDISERKKLELDLQKAHVVVEEASYAREQFLSSMSHELHTPLNNILGHLQLLRRDPIMGDLQKQQLTLAEEAGYYLLRLVNDILELSKIDSEKSPIQAAECSIKTLAQSLFDKVHKKAMAKGLDFNLTLAPDLPKEIILDEFKLKQILMGLLSNAIKYTERGEISLAVGLVPSEKEPSEHSGLQQQNQYIEFVVSDTGIGIDESMKQAVFQPFTQLGGANAKGTGLGLSIALRLAKSMAGQLELVSQVGRGSQFSLRLPYESTSSELFEEQAMFVTNNQEMQSSGDLEIVGLAKEQHQSLCQAAKVGDIETLQDIFSHLEAAGLGEHDWLQHCKTLLSHFDIESLLSFLDSGEANKEALS